MRENPQASMVDVAENACAASIFVNHAFDDRCVRDVAARR